MLKSLLILSFLFVNKSECFIPKQILTYVIGKADEKLNYDMGYVSESLTHEEIIRRGILRSVTRYFYDQPNGNTKINLNKIDNEYLNPKNIYYDYYGIYYCNLDLEEVIEDEFQPNVASVDFDENTKDLPYAHFDAETFIESNKRVIDQLTIVNTFNNLRDYESARKYLGQVMHTIHDFYSHSNWVEMGNYDKINDRIGNTSFNSLPIAGKNETPTCVSNCTIIEVECSIFLKALASFIKGIGFPSSIISCPIKYFRCKGNIVLGGQKLVSGYYVDQTLPDGTPIAKPGTSSILKCSHGGIVDGDSFKEAQGGINKDSGYYLFSPHADLHTIAANLAINHTEYLFENIRKNIGAAEYAKFLKLAVKTTFQDQVNKFFEICSSSNLSFTKYLFFISFVINYLFLKNLFN